MLHLSVGEHAVPERKLLHLSVREHAVSERETAPTQREGVCGLSERERLLYLSVREHAVSERERERHFSTSA